MFKNLCLYVFLSLNSIVFSGDTDVFSSVQKLLSKNDFNGALSAYNGAVRKESNNCAVREARGSLLLSLGRPDEAYEDFLYCKDRNMNPKIIQAAKQIGRLKEAISFIKQSDDENIKNMENHLVQLQVDLLKANSLYENKQFSQAISIYSTLKDELSHDFSVIEKMYRIYKSLNNYNEAIKMLRIILVKYPGKADDFMEDAIRIDLLEGNFETSLETSRKCLKRDQDSIVCKSLYRELKSFTERVSKVQEMITKESFDEAIESIEMSISQLKDSMIIEKSSIIFDPLRCQAYSALSNRKTLETCNRALSYAKNKADIYYFLGKYMLALENYDEAVEKFNKAVDIDPHHSKAKQSLESVKKIKKTLAKKDYYKILGLSKTATKKEVKKAFRKLSLLYHPDKNPNDPTSSQKYNDIVRANEVLSDPKNREMYDQGIDPSDPESQQQQQQQHYQQGFNSFFHGFQGNPFQGFHFHF